MKKIHRGEKGFTLIELLVVIAILGILAAVGVVGVTKFIGGGKSEAAATELQNVQTAVDAMMAAEDISELPNPVATATNNMKQFPDWDATAGKGYVLCPEDAGAYKNSSETKFIRTTTTKGTYTCAPDGTVTQLTTGYE